MSGNSPLDQDGLLDAGACLTAPGSQGSAPQPPAASSPDGADPSRWPSVVWDDDGYPVAEEDGFAQWRALPPDLTKAARFLLDELPFAATRCCCSCWIEDAYDIRYRNRPLRRIHFSTGGWSGAESLMALIESRYDTQHFMELWRRGGHYVFEIPKRIFGDSDGSPKGGDAEGGSVHDSAGRQASPDQSGAA